MTVERSKRPSTLLAFTFVTKCYFYNVYFSYKSLTHFRFKLLQSSRQRKQEVALDLAFDLCELGKIKLKAMLASGLRRECTIV